METDERGVLLQSSKGRLNRDSVEDISCDSTPATSRQATRRRDHHYSYGSINGVCV